MNTTAVSGTTSAVMTEAHHMTQAALLFTTTAFLCATNFFGTTSTWNQMIVNNVSPDQAKGLGMSISRKDQVMSYNDCNQIGSRKVTLKAVPLKPKTSRKN